MMAVFGALSRRILMVSKPSIPGMKISTITASNA